MVEIFRNWIVSMLCLGILIVIVQLVVPKTNLRKYIYSLVGIITVITIVSPVVDLLKNGNVRASIDSILNTVSPDENNIVSVNSEGLDNKNDELVKAQFIQNLKSDVMFKLAHKDIVVNNINIVVDDEYNVTKIELNIAKLDNEKTDLGSVNEVVGYINSEYDIDYSKISVVEEGE
ncbi:stage III sporulation protein AF SpoIIIAF [Clostridium sp. CAG:465]|jgi:hypothetical protein|nr:stage III sporulation protein AF SpoIIIAF [Clostridium sp. CAG:465]